MLKRRIDVDFTCKLGKIKPVNGMVGGPFFGDEIPDGTELYRELAIPVARLANPTFGTEAYIDVHNVFPDPSLDERFDLSYNFGEADRFVLAARDAGASVFLRLGESPERGAVKRYTRMPQDPEKWARICGKIISHYNEGFAGGFKLGIKYVEIFDSPDTQGSFALEKQEYFRLYRTVAGYLKKRFPRIKVGAYASGGFRSQNHVGTSDEERAYVDYLDDFLSFIGNKETAAPLDFLSWCCYAETPEELSLHTNYARSFLNHHGFKKTESIISRFNSHASKDGCAFLDRRYPAFLASCLITATKSDADMMFYADGHPYSAANALYSLDDRVSYRRYASYSVMRAFGALAAGKSNRVESSEDYPHEIYSLATLGADHGFVLIATRKYDGVLEVLPVGGDFTTYSVEGIIGGGDRGAGFVNRVDGIPLGSGITLRVGKDEVYFITLSR